MSEHKHVKVIDKNTNTVLYSCSIEEIDTAYDYAKKMEDLDIDVEVISPGSAMSLALNLGATPKEIEALQGILEDEIEDHNL